MKNKLKRLLAGVVALAMVVAMLPAMGMNAFAVDVGDLKYSLNEEENTATVTGLSDSASTTIVIPETVKIDEKTYDVTAIGKSAFSESHVTSITVPASISYVAEYAFYSCSQLTSLTFKGVPDVLGESALYCDNDDELTLTVPEDWNTDDEMYKPEAQGLSWYTLVRIPASNAPDESWLEVDGWYEEGPYTYTGTDLMVTGDLGGEYDTRLIVGEDSAGVHSATISARNGKIITKMKVFFDTLDGAYGDALANDELADYETDRMNTYGEMPSLADFCVNGVAATETNGNIQYPVAVFNGLNADTFELTNLLRKNAGKDEYANKLYQVRKISVWFDDAPDPIDPVGTSIPLSGTTVGGDTLTTDMTITLPEGIYTKEDLSDDEGEDPSYVTTFVSSNPAYADIDFYLWKKDQSMKEDVLEEAHGNPVTYRTINGINVAYYYDLEEDEDGDTYKTLTYLMDDGEYIAELVFWLDKNTSDEDVLAAASGIIGTVKAAHDYNDEGVCSKCKKVKATDAKTHLEFTKNYTDLFNGTQNATDINEEVTFAIAPMVGQTYAPAFDSVSYSFDVEDGVANISIPLPDTLDTFGEYWYTLTETAGTTAGVVYNSTTYYVHLIAAFRNDELGIVSATIHKTRPSVDNDEWSNNETDTTDKISTITNQYGKGDLVINQVVEGNDAEDTDEFTTTIILNANGKTVVGNITCGDQTIKPEDWEDDGTCTIEVKLTGDSSATIEGIPAYVTYTVAQTDNLAELGYVGPAYTLGDDTESANDMYVEGDDNVIGSITDTKDTITITNTKNSPIDVGVILENGTYVAMGIGAVAVMAFLFLSRNKKYEAE